jgi:hypothetical protein
MLSFLVVLPSVLALALLIRLKMEKVLLPKPPLGRYGS